jgi:hypothetical protein
MLSVINRIGLDIIERGVGGFRGATVTEKSA